MGKGSKNKNKGKKAPKAVAIETPVENDISEVLKKYEENNTVTSDKLASIFSDMSLQLTKENEDALVMLADKNGTGAIAVEVCATFNIC
jgi:signal recognition particle subunit SEC65